MLTQYKKMTTAETLKAKILENLNRNKKKKMLKPFKTNNQKIFI